MASSIRVGTRASKMAQVQADEVIRKMQIAFPNVLFEKCVTKADADTHENSLRMHGGKGGFVSRLDSGLVSREFDITVNCLKDIPNAHERCESIVIAGVLPRDDTHDVVVTRAGVMLKDLAPNSAIGTVAPRRIAQVTRNLPHLRCVHFRGSADTRITKLEAGAVDAVILAGCGLERIGMRDKVTEELSEDLFPPAFGAGIVTIDCLAERHDVRSLIDEISHRDTFRCMTAERGFVDAIQGNCTTAMAGKAICNEDGRISIKVSVYSSDGRDQLEGYDSCPAGQEAEMGERLAASMVLKGARDIMAL